jgi:6-pyruvoyltetrahydropterin/6-carboxytetrahydropterin synthase
MELSRTFQIEAAHRLPHAPDGHRCRRLHGHSFKITVTVAGEIAQPEGWVFDFAEIDAAFEPYRERLDHHYLNEVEGLENPTSENLAIWLWRALIDALPGLAAVEVGETCRGHVTYRGPGEGDWS